MAIKEESMARVFSCFLLLTSALCTQALGCDESYGRMIIGKEKNQDCGTSKVGDATVTNNSDTSKLATLLGNNFTDPTGLIWNMSAKNGINSATLLANGFIESWFFTPSPGSRYQRFYYKVFPTTPAPAEDPMVDGPALCSLFLDANYGWYVWLRRTADTVPCPSIAECTYWLPDSRSLLPLP